MWAAILEKAWAKVRGNYVNANGGIQMNAIHMLTGVPVFSYSTAAITDTTEAETAYNRILAADAAGYIMTAGTAGSGNDQVTNACGIAMSHAYSILAAFTMTDASGTAHKCYMIRNPWGTAGYTGTWNKDDTDWTDALVAQVPFGVDPRTAQASDGIFIVPNTIFIGDNCFDGYQIGHYRDGEGYSNKWIDNENSVDNQIYNYYFQTDNSGSDLYFSVSTYPYMVVPISCTTCTISSGQSVNYPVAYMAIYEG